MKFRLTVLLCCLLPLWAYPTDVVAQNSELQVHVEDATVPMQAVLFTINQGQAIPVDTIGLDAAGNFRIVTREQTPAFFLMHLVSKNLHRSLPMLHVLLLPGEQVSMTMRVDTVSGLIHISQVYGSDNMEEYRLFHSMLNDAATSPSKQAQLSQQVERLLTERSSNLMSAFLVTFFENDFNRYAPLYKYIHDALAGRYPDDVFVRHLYEKTRNMLLAGMEAPEIEMLDRNGQKRRLSDLRGKVVLVDFWASWCRPCRMENPNVVRLYHKYHDQGFEVFSVSLDKGREDWLAAIQQDGLVWDNHVSDLKGWTSSGGKTYGISSIPATVLIAPDGTILARNLRGSELAAKLEEIFGK